MPEGWATTGWCRAPPTPQPPELRRQRRAQRQFLPNVGVPAARSRQSAPALRRWVSGRRGRGGIPSPAQRRNGATVREKSNPSNGLSVAAGKTTVCNGATVKTGLNLQQYAAAKRLPVEFLRVLAFPIHLSGRPRGAHALPGHGGEVLGVRFRIALDGDRFRWKSGSKPRLDGLNGIPHMESIELLGARRGGVDRHTLWFHGIPAIGIPGAGNWNEGRDAKPFRWRGNYLCRRRGRQRRRGCQAMAVDIIDTASCEASSSPDYRPLCALPLEIPDGFKKAWEVALPGAVPWTVYEADTQTDEGR